MDPKLEDRVVLVVGGSGLIGRAVVERLAAEGAIAISASRGGDGGIVFDARDDVSVSTGIADVLLVHGRLDGVVVTAAPSAQTLDPAKNSDPTQVLDAVDAKAIAFLRVANAALATMTSAGYGRIVGVSGQNAFLTGNVTGAVRNAALIVVAKNLADSVAGTGVTVNTVSPGAVSEHPASHVAHGVKPWLGHLRLEQVTAGHIEEAMTEWSGGPSTKIDALAVLSRLLDGAVRAKLIPLNQARLIRRPRPDPQLNLRSRALTLREVGLVLEAVPAGPYRNYVAALIYTGMRANEAAALQVGDVDLNNRSIHVHRNFGTDLDGQVKEYTPKSHKERDVPITAALVPHLMDAMAGKTRSALVFTGPKGGRINGSNIRRALKWDRVKALVDRSDYRLHDLRHTLATLLFDGGAAANDVQAIMGHSTLQMTERYSRARSDAARRGADKLDGLFGANGA